MSDNSYEYIIKQKTEGKVLIKKLSVAISYFLFALILIFLSVNLADPVLHLPLILIILAVTALIAFVSWHFLCVEYEVIIGGGDIIFTVIYGKGFRKQLVNMSINSFSEIGEYDEKAYDKISSISLQKNYICLSSLSADTVYYALFEDGKDQCIIYFDAPERAVDLLKKHNSTAFRASEKRMKEQ